jgi:hypothetical protein
MPTKFDFVSEKESERYGFSHEIIPTKYFIENDMYEDIFFQNIDEIRTKIANYPFDDTVLKYGKRIKITVIMEYNYSKETDYKIT